MRDHFDPLSVVYQNQHHNLKRMSQGPCHHTSTSVVQEHFHSEKQPNGFDAGVSSQDAAPAAFEFPSWKSNIYPPQNDESGNIRSNTHAHTPGTKRTSRSEREEFLDCNVLQSSLKRVRLSHCPGEFRLKRDLKTLDPRQWSASDESNAVAFSSITWIHRSSGARLAMVDSLRICLFLPGTTMHSNTNQQQQQFQHHASYHRDYRWRIMVQLPRMYPHRPPEVTRIEGLSLESIAIQERPPGEPCGKHAPLQVHDHRDDPSFFTEEQLARSSSLTGTVNTNANTIKNANENTRDARKALEWNEWSPVSGLGELLDFLLVAAASHPSTVVSNAADKRRIFGTVSSSASSTWGNGHDPAGADNNHASHNRSNPSVLFGGGSSNHAVMMEETEPSKARESVGGASFLLPNRFDVGYGRYGYEKYNQNPASFAGASRGTSADTSTRSNTSLGARLPANTIAYRDHHHDEDAGMELG